jgi:hypothetical protein
MRILLITACLIVIGFGVAQALISNDLAKQSNNLMRLSPSMKKVPGPSWSRSII